MTPQEAINILNGWRINHNPSNRPQELQALGIANEALELKQQIDDFNLTIEDVKAMKEKQKIKKQRVIRTSTPDVGYRKDYSTISELDEFLKNGWYVVMCNTIQRKDGEQWLEYIIEKEEVKQNET